MNRIYHRAERRFTPWKSGKEIPGEDLLACYLFALDDMPCRGLKRHDLQGLPLTRATVPENALVLIVRRGAA